MPPPPPNWSHNFGICTPFLWFGSLARAREAIAMVVKKKPKRIKYVHMRVSVLMEKANCVS